MKSSDGEKWLLEARGQRWRGRLRKLLGGVVLGKSLGISQPGLSGLDETRTPA